VVEQLTFNQLVAGSIPAPLTNIFKGLGSVVGCRSCGRCDPGAIQSGNQIL
jgi:hypothetical protein